MTASPQRIFVEPFGARRLESVLELQEPPFARGREPFLQLRYVERYLKKLNCGTIAVEWHYIDRDYMEDHSVFYSRNLSPYENYCKRVHFFSGDVDAINACLHKLIESAAELGDERFRQECRSFSEHCYLGFSVIKPLHGSPVGRTVLRHYPNDSKEFLRNFDCTRLYHAHFFGIELSVRGLAFQQQDTGVSACATTAVWSAIQKVRDLEGISAATPAQITTLASQFSLRFGRTMPSEAGLSIDQMCQAIRALGLSPNLFRVERYDIARGILYSAVVSGMAPILILRALDNSTSHAVTVAGIKLRNTHEHNAAAGMIDEQASDLIAAYVHDDRAGPYLSALLESAGGKLDSPPRVKLSIEVNGKTINEEWILSHILIPMHPKIRLSFQGLRDVATTIVKSLIAQARATAAKDDGLEIRVETRIIRAYRYTEELLFAGIRRSDVEQFSSNVPLARYVGVVRLTLNTDLQIDVLVDTTDTPRNLHCSGVILRRGATDFAKEVATFLTERFGCAAQVMAQY